MGRVDIVRLQEANSFKMSLNWFNSPTAVVLVKSGAACRPVCLSDQEKLVLLIPIFPPREPSAPLQYNRGIFWRNKML